MLGYELNVTGQTLYVFAFDSTTGKGKTGEAANITIYYQEKGGASTNLAQTITEVDATNMPGVYSAPIPQGIIDTQYTFFHPKCSTANIGMAPAPPAFLVPAGFSTSPMRGTDNAFLAANAPANFADLAIVASTGLVSANMAQALPGSPTADTLGNALKNASVSLPQATATGGPGGLPIYENLVLGELVTVATATSGGDFTLTSAAHADYASRILLFLDGPNVLISQKITTFTDGTNRCEFTGLNPSGAADERYSAFPNTPVTGNSALLIGVPG